jgi:hypothetical protein
MNGDEDTVPRNPYVQFMGNPIHLTRRSDGRTHQLVLTAPGYTVTVELRVTGLELSATELERALHAPLSALAASRESI